MNYKNIYYLKDYELHIFEAERKAELAKSQIKQAKENYKIQVSKYLNIPIENLEFSNVCCIAKGIANHVYHIKIKSSYGNSENKCIYCDCDNVEDLY